MGEIKAICISEKRGTQKHAVEEAVFVTEYGIEGDAHAGNWHRQVSFLGLEEIEDFRRRGAQVELGAFGENVVAEGFCFKELPILICTESLTATTASFHVNVSFDRT